jgi:hypothetical protein
LTQVKYRLLATALNQGIATPLNLEADQILP